MNSSKSLTQLFSDLVLVLFPNHSIDFNAKI